MNLFGPVETMVEEATIQQQFETYRLLNPQVEAALLAMARELKDRGETKTGIGMLWEVLRWKSYLSPNRIPGSPAPAFPNNFRSRYARRLMADHPELAGFFDTAELRTP